MSTVFPKKTKCPHCKGETFSGIHNGCEKCGKTKHNGNGRKNISEKG